MGIVRIKQMNIETGIIIGGVLSLGIAIFHCFFYSFFNWKNELEKISVLNTKVFITLHIGLIAFFLFFTFLSFAFTEELSNAKGLAGTITGFYALLWFFRTIWQIIYFDPLRKQNPQLHYILILWFIVLFIVYSIPIANKLL